MGSIQFIFMIMIIVYAMQVPFQHSVYPQKHPDLPQHAAGHLHEHHQQLHGTGGCRRQNWGSEWVYFQNIGVLYRLIIGCQHPLLARLNNDCLYMGFYMFLTTNCCITIFRILLVIKVRRNCGKYILDCHSCSARQVLECWSRASVQDSLCGDAPPLSRRHPRGRALPLTVLWRQVSLSL